MTLRLTVEIVPFGMEEAKIAIHLIEISNVGKSPGRDGFHLYKISVDGKALDSKIPPHGIEHDSRIMHKRSDGALKLCEIALERINWLQSKKTP